MVLAPLAALEEWGEGHDYGRVVHKYHVNEPRHEELAWSQTRCVVIPFTRELIYIICEISQTKV